MKNLTKSVLSAIAFCAFVFSGVTPARAESISLFQNGASQGSFNCTGSNGCFGNDLKLDVSGSGTNWTVKLSVDTTGNTNPGAGIAAADFVLTGFSYSAANVTLTTAPGADWLAAAGPASAGGSGCQSSTSNQTCAFDPSLFTSTPTDFNASPLGGPTYTWVWTIKNETFGGFDDNTHVQLQFGKITSSGCGNNPAPCYKTTGLISTGATNVPEPTSLTLLGIGLAGLGASVRRRLGR